MGGVRIVCRSGISNGTEILDAVTGEIIDLGAVTKIEFEPLEYGKPVVAKITIEGVKFDMESDVKFTHEMKEDKVNAS